MSATTTCDRCDTTVPSRKARSSWLKISRRSPNARADDLFPDQVWDVCSPACATAVIVEKVEPTFAMYNGV